MFLSFKVKDRDCWNEDSHMTSSWYISSQRRDRWDVCTKSKTWAIQIEVKRRGRTGTKSLSSHANQIIICLMPHASWWDIISHGSICSVLHASDFNTIITQVHHQIPSEEYVFGFWSVLQTLLFCMIIFPFSQNTSHSWGRRNGICERLWKKCISFRRYHNICHEMCVLLTQAVKEKSREARSERRGRNVCYGHLFGNIHYDFRQNYFLVFDFVTSIGILIIICLTSSWWWSRCLMSLPSRALILF